MHVFTIYIDYTQSWVNVKLFLSIPSMHVWGVEVWLYTPRHQKDVSGQIHVPAFTPGKESLIPVEQVGPKAHLGPLGKRKISCSCRDSNLVSSIPQRRQYSDYAIPACISDLDLLTVLHTLVTATLGSALEQFCCREDEREPLLVRQVLLNLQDPETI